MKISPYRSAAAISYMSAGPYDVRPRLLVLYFNDEFAQLDPVLRYGCNYLWGWYERQGRQPSEVAIHMAARDALARLLTRRAGASVAARARMLRMRDADFREMRTVVSLAYRNRLAEACQRFLWAALSDDGTDLHLENDTMEVA